MEVRVERPRWIGAAAAGTLATLVMIGLFVALGATGLAESSAFALIFGESGVLSPTVGFIPVWLAPPLAAAAAGWILLPAAGRREAWAGSAMGTWTFLIGVTIGTFLVVVLGFPPSSGFPEGAATGLNPLDLIGEVLTGLAGTLALSLFAAVFLAPLLPVSIASGIVWARIIRGLLPSPEGAAGERSVLPGLLILLFVIGLSLLWLGAQSVMDALSQSGFD